MDSFKTSDFVQVEHVVLLGKGEPTYIWRNALYVEKDEKHGAHVVAYTDGSIEVLNAQTKIRKVEVTEKFRHGAG